MAASWVYSQGWPKLLPNAPKKKNYKAKTTYSIYNIHIAHKTALRASMEEKCLVCLIVTLEYN